MQWIYSSIKILCCSTLLNSALFISVHFLQFQCIPGIVQAVVGTDQTVNTNYIQFVELVAFDWIVQPKFA
jgi:hypothetical protein